MISSKSLLQPRSIPKNIQPGNVTAKLKEITLEKAIEPDSYNVILHLETDDLGPSFEGFLVDKDNPEGPRYKGQVGKVKLSPFYFGWTINNKPTNRDKNILEGIHQLAVALGKKNEFDLLQAPSIEPFVSLVSLLLSGDTLINWCIGGKEYQKGNYTRYELSLPKITFLNGVADKLPYELPGTTPSRLIVFERDQHIYKKRSESVTSFQPNTSDFIPAISSDFEL